MSDSPAKPPGRPMKYPYTLSAKLAQFPIKWFYKNSVVFRYGVPACAVTAVIFYQFQKMSYSPANVEKWRKLDNQALGLEPASH